MKRNGWITVVVGVSTAALAMAACSASDGGGGGGNGGAGNFGGFGATDAGDAGGYGNFGNFGGTGATGGTAGAAGAGGSGGTAGAAGAAGTAGTDGGGPTVSVSGRTVQLIDLVTAIPGFKVCLYQQPSVPCVMSDSNGFFSLGGVPPNADVLLEFTKQNYFSVLRTATTGPNGVDVGSAGYPTNSEALFFASAIGSTIDITKGQILLSAFQPGSGSGLAGQDGVSASMTPSSGNGPYYVNASNVPDPNLTATSTAGFGLYNNVEPGTVEIEMSHPTKTCAQLALAAWAGSKANASKVPVVAGYLTAGAAVECN